MLHSRNQFEKKKPAMHNPLSAATLPGYGDSGSRFDSPVTRYYQNTYGLSRHSAAVLWLFVGLVLYAAKAKR